MNRIVKKLLLALGVFCIAGVVTLALVPHYTCGCGQDEGIPKKSDGSMLTVLIRNIIG